MNLKSPNQYHPDNVSHPCDTLLEAMESRGLTCAAAALQLGMTVDALNLMIAGAEYFTDHAAQELERVLGIPAKFWLARAKHYRQAQGP